MNAFTDPGAGLLDQLGAYLASGGYVTVPLLLVATALWYALGVRWALLQRGSKKNVRVLLRRHLEGRAGKVRGITGRAIELGLALRARGVSPLRRHLDDAFAEFEQDLGRHARTVTALVAVAPLLGLLGTVAGMIETFASLGEMSLFSQTGGIAGGIATALFTTQLGLVVAVPGYVCKALLDRRQQQIAMDLARIKDLLVSEPPPEPES